MANNHTQIQAQQKTKNGKGAVITAQHTTTDSPLIPINEVERLAAIKPEWGQFVLDETKAEANHRRTLQNESQKMQTKVNSYIFMEHLFGILAAVLIGLVGIGVAAYLVLHGYSWEGVSIATAAMGTLAVAFLNKKSKDTD